MTPGPNNLITDVPGLRVGHAQDHTLKSGVTVLVGDRPMTTSHHTMGGAPGTRETDLLAPDKSVAQVDALVLSGGSAFGLDACGGVMDALLRDRRGFAVGPVRVPLVPGAIVFDLLNGGDKAWETSPYPALGAAAYKAAGLQFDLGTAGGGTGALCGDFKGGVGSASCVLESGHTVGALVVANAIGNVATPDGHLWAAAFEHGEEFGGSKADTAKGLAGPQPNAKLAAMQLSAGEADRANTTIAIIATDAPLTKAECQRLAIASHDGIARAIVPAHTPHDGDLVFAVSTKDPTPQSNVDLTDVCHAGAMCLTRAIGRAVFHATPAEGDLLPIWTIRR